MAYLTIVGPETLRFAGDRAPHVTLPEEYLGWHAQMLLDRGESQRHFDTSDIAAKVNWGRWLVDCPCGSAALTRPDWKLACCAECGAVYTNVVFPSAIADLTEALLARPKRENQNWIPGETIRDLERENVEHGLGGEEAPVS